MRSLYMETPIAELPDWHFATGDLPGVSEEELIAFERGGLPQKRFDEIVFLGTEALRRFADMDVPGVEPWMSVQRRSN